MEFLVDHHLFKELSEENLRILYDKAQPKKLKSGTTITQEGEKNKGFYLLRHGLIKITRKNKDGREIILWLAAPGDCPGIDSAFSTELYKTSSVTIKDSFAYFFPKKAFDRILVEYPSIAMEMMKYISEKISDLEARIFNMNKKRKGLYFAEILYSLDSKRGNNTIVPDIISVEELANLLGADKRYVYSLIKDLEDKSLISFENGKLEITNAIGIKNHLSSPIHT
jgi:CRP/FNR family cyclic AMP-dependent transcriptional regulator